MKLLIFFILFLLCFVSAEEGFRDYFMPITAAAYSDDPNKCLSKVFKDLNCPNCTIYRKYTVRCDSLNDACSAYISVAKGYQYTEIFVVFRGTNNNYAIIENGWNYDKMVPFVVGGKVSKIFFDAFNNLWNAGMKDDLLTLKNKYPLLYSPFYFLGHSLGGAMASLAAATFQKVDTNIMVWLMTFGQPRIGDKEFSEFFDFMGFYSMRFIHKADIVPHLPPLNQSVYYHHHIEYWYNNDMGANDDLVDCYSDNDENPECSDSLNPSEYNMNDHKYYFGRDFIQYGVDGCPDLETSKRNNLKNTLAKIPHPKLYA